MKSILRAAVLAAILVEISTFLQPTAPLLLQSPGIPGQESSVRGTSAIRGRVMQGLDPVPSAEVTLILPGASRPGARVSAPSLRRTTTDALGRFAFREVSPGACRIAANAPGLAPASMAVEIPVDPEGIEVSIELDPGSRVEGQVQSGGDPVAGAQLRLWIAGEASTWQPGGRPLREGATDEAGRFRLEGLPVGGRVRILVRAAGYRPREIAATPAEGKPLSIELVSGSFVSGRVITSSNLPVAGAEVSGSQGEGYPAESGTEPDGAFRLEGLADRPVTIWIRKEGFAPGRIDLLRPAAGVSVVLLQEGGLAGRVEPALGAAFLVVVTESATIRRPLGADGVFRWTGLPPGEVRVGAVDRSGRVLVERRLAIPEGRTAEGIVLAP